MIYRCVLAPWAAEEDPSQRRVREGEFTQDRLDQLNLANYSIYYLPNYPSVYEKGVTVDGSHIDTFEWVFVDMDLKDGTYANKEDFIEVIGESGIEPNRIVDSGNGVHVYWRVTDLNALDFLRLQRRLCRLFKTDEAVSKIYQLMRVPGTINPKNKEEPKLCELLYENTEISYTCEEFDTLLPPIAHADDEYCQSHFDKTYRIGQEDVKINDKLPLKFEQLLRDSPEVKEIWSGNVDDRSKGDYRIGHIMHGHGFTRDEALSVLVNTEKARERAPVHRFNYATNIVDKIWTFEITVDKESLNLSSTVKEILERSPDTLKGTPFRCWRYFDATHHGFRLSQVIGLVAGSGVGKTAVALNMFEGFVKNNPDYEHFFVPLEQPGNEIADRWKTLCGTNTQLYEKVHILSNYDDDGTFRHLSFEEIKEYILKFQRVTGKKVGCIVIDHIGALKKKGKDGENQDLMDICHSMKAFAVQTNTLLVMQSQSSREKAGIGDLELSKDAAYGTVYFESYCDYLVTIWQPLKRCYSEDGCPTITAFKFCKIRHKKKGVDEIQEDVVYRLYFDPETERLRELTNIEEKSFDYFVTKALNKRKADRKTDIVSYNSMPWKKEEVVGGKASNHKN